MERNITSPLASHLSEENILSPLIGHLPENATNLLATQTTISFIF